MKPAHTLLCLCLVLLLGAVAQTATAASWTVLVYLDGDNNLEDMAILDVNEMELAPASSQVNVLVQFDRTPLYDTSNGNWTETRRYRIVPDDDPLTITSELLADLGERNMGAPATLVDFFTWGAQQYPADHYLVILWDHGNGWRTAAAGSSTKAICQDNTDFDVLTTAEVVSAFAEIRAGLGRNVDIVACDACQMGVLELAYPLRASADYYVASQEEVPDAGFAYDVLLTALAGNPSLSPAQLAQVMVNGYVASYHDGSQGSARVSLSAVDLSHLSAVGSALTGFADQLIGATGSIPTYGDDLHTWWEMTHQESDFTAVDLRFFADLVQADAPTTALRTAAEALLGALQEAVVATSSAFYPVDQHQGLSLYYPFLSSFEPGYLDLELATDTTWDEFLQVSPTSQSCVPDLFEPDDAWTQAPSVTLTRTHGRHWFHVEGEQDWVQFAAEEGRRYAIATERLGQDADTLVSLFGPDGTTLLAQDDDSGWETNASLIATDGLGAGLYYAMVQQYAPDFVPPYYGGRTYYDVLISPISFTDVAPGYWAFRPIEACARASIVFGYWDGAYRPAETVNRAQMAVYVARTLAGGDATVPTGPVAAFFPDIPTDHWAFKYVEYCHSQGVVGGYWDGYHPDEIVDRAQMAVYISRAVAGGDDSVPDDPDGIPFFPDMPSGHWAYKYVEYAHDQGIVGGYWDGYHPDDAVTRDQMAVFIARAFGLEERSSASAQNGHFEKALDVSPGSVVRTHTVMAQRSLNNLVCWWWRGEI